MKNCKCNKTCDCAVKDLSTDCVILGETLTCSGIQEGTILSEALKQLDEFVCERTQNPVSTTLENIGDGEGEIYAGVSQLGAKQIRTVRSTDSIEIDTDEDVITASISQDWINENIQAGKENIVEFDTTDPNTQGTTFDPDTPTDIDALFWSNVNNSTWKYNGLAYVTAPLNPNQTPFYYDNTTNDIGGNKIAPMVRQGSVGIRVTEIDPKVRLDVGGQIKQTHKSTILKADAGGIIVPATAGTDYLAPNGSAAQLTNFPTLNQNTTGNAATVTTIPSLTGDVTNAGNVVTLVPSGVTAGSYTNPNVTVDTKGRVTAISNGSAGLRPLRDFYVDAPNTSNTVTTLYSYSIPANTLNNNGDKIRGVFGGQLVSPGVSKQLGLNVGGYTYNFTTTSNGTFAINFTIMRKNATSSLVVYSAIYGVDEGSYSAEQIISGWNSTQIISLTGQATNTSDITARIGTIEFVPAAP